MVLSESSDPAIDDMSEFKVFVLIVAAVTTPVLASVVRVIGAAMLISDWQFSSCQLATQRCARKVNVLFAAAGASEAKLVSMAWSSVIFGSARSISRQYGPVWNVL